MNPDFGLAADDYAEHRAGFPEEILRVPHRVFAIHARPPAAPAIS